MIVTDDNEYVIFESSVLLPGGGNDILNLDKKRFDLLRGGYCVGDTDPGCFFYGETLTVGVELGKTQLGVKRTHGSFTGRHCASDVGPGFLCSGEKWAENIAQIVFVLIE